MLLAWHDILRKLRMSITYLLRDVATCWNSTFDMLEYALKHWMAVDKVTQQHEPVLWKFELTDQEWLVVEQLHNILKVCLTITMCWHSISKHNINKLTLFLPGTQGCNTFLFKVHTVPHNSHSGDGPHWQKVHNLLLQQKISSCNLFCCHTHQEDTRPLLLTHWPLRSVLHCYG